MSSLVQMPDLDLKIRVKALHVCELTSAKPEFDPILLAVKSFDTRWMPSRPWRTTPGRAPARRPFTVASRAARNEIVNGLASRKGKELGIPTPCNDAVSKRARAIKRKELEIDPSNYEVRESWESQVERKDRQEGNTNHTGPGMRLRGR